MKKKPTGKSRGKHHPPPRKKRREHYLVTKLREYRAEQAQIPIRRQAARAKKLAYDARAAYRPRKADRGKYIFVDTTGKREPGKKGRRGYLIYVTKTGRKWLIKEKRSTQPLKARTRSKVIIPSGPRLRLARQKFVKSRLVTVHKQTITKGSGGVNTGGAHDFSAAVVKRIAAGVRRVVDSQASHRIFLVKFIARVKLPTGEVETIQGEVPIEYPDHVAISSIGVQAWVQHKFYSFLARELAFAGYVSNGSANHIRSLTVPDPDSPGDTIQNRDLPREQWMDKRGEPWSGRDKEQVEIERIDWKIEQAK